MDKNVSRFVARTIAKAVSSGITVNLDNKSSIRYRKEKGRHCGFFSEMNGGVLSVACGKPLETWLPVLLHESCHMDQFLDEDPIWTMSRLPCGEDATDILFDWLGGAGTRGYYPSFLARLTLLVELDCEKRSVQKIEKYKLEKLVPIEEYIQKANAYLYLYVYAGIYRRYQKEGAEVYNDPRIWKKAPKKFGGSYKKVPPALLKAFQEHV